MNPKSTAKFERIFSFRPTQSKLQHKRLKIRSLAINHLNYEIILTEFIWTCVIIGSHFPNLSNTRRNSNCSSWDLNSTYFWANLSNIRRNSNYRSWYLNSTYFRAQPNQNNRSYKVNWKGKYWCKQAEKNWVAWAPPTKKTWHKLSHIWERRWNGKSETRAALLKVFMGVKSGDWILLFLCTVNTLGDILIRFIKLYLSHPMILI